MKSDSFCNKARRILDKVFSLSGIERPQNKALNLCRVVGMNRVESFGVPKPHIDKISNHNVTDNNEALRR